MGKLLYLLIERWRGVQMLEAPNVTFRVPMFRICAFRGESSGLNEKDEHEDFWFRLVAIHVPLPTYGTAFKNLQLTRSRGWAMLTWINHSRAPSKWQFMFERTPV